MRPTPPLPDLAMNTINTSVKADPQLSERLILEQDKLFDYLLRMTANQDRSIDAMKQAIKIMLQKHDSKIPYPIVRKELYATARSLCSDIWNADTSNLSNPAVSNYAPVDQQRFKKEEINNLDRYLHRLTGKDREIVLLKNKYNFIFNDTQEICQSTKDLKPINEKILGDLKVLMNRPTEEISQAISYAPYHPMPPSTQFHTQALSDLMNDLQSRKSTILIKNSLWLLMVIVIIFMIVWLIYGYT